ncbi:hypothetical protein [Paenibacillus cymbidii]|uniref:hypothetical protein n=1 Tax=Paenibacillus cymbidii TaxID=1639034 RepID=UPI0010800FE6|nr:hypothetical protein [Paenibacillus cymbidii]
MEKAVKELIRDCILLPAAIRDVHSNARDISAGVLQKLCILTAKALHDRLVLDYQAATRELRSHGCTVILGPNEQARQAYIVRSRGGSERTIWLDNIAAKFETKTIIERYMAELETYLEEKRHAQ